MENKDAAKKAIDELLAYENRIIGGDRNVLFGAEAPRDVMMDRDFTDFIAQLDMSGFTAIPPAESDSFQMNSMETADFKHQLRESDYESLQKLMLQLIRTERFAPGLINSLYQEGYFVDFFNKLRNIKENL